MFLRHKISYLSIGAVAIVFLAGVLFFNNEKKDTPEVKAAGTDNVMGFAWSENIGWISFNSLNCDTNSNGFIDTNAITLGCSGNDNATTPVIDYGVNLDAGGTNNLSGYAWSGNIGWISFQAGDVAGCPGGGNCQPRLVGSDFYGWARVLANGGGWDGWISLNSENCDIDINNFIDVVCGGDNTTTSTINYNIILNGADLEGFAWGSNVVGWVSFNCINEGVCGISNYKVRLTNNNPTASNLAISADYCAIVPVRTFNWNYNDADGDDESQFQLQIDDSSDFSSPEVNICGDGTAPLVSGYCSAPGALSVPSGGGNFKNINVMEFPGPDQLGYNKTYHWRVRVWDSNGGSSIWIIYDTDTDLSTPDVGTPLHPYPNARFTCSPNLGVSCPASHNILEPITFDDDPDRGSDPDRYGSYVFDWDFCKTTIPACPNNIANNVPPPVDHTYTTGGSYVAELKVIDNDGYFCVFSQILNIANVHPKWNEISPN